MAYRIGIDAGSKTIKVVVLGEDGRLLHSIYRRHRTDIKTTLAEALHDLVWRHGDIRGTVGVTGSAGIGLAEMLGLPFTQEVVATTRAVQDAYPQADAIIELGGEDAKIVYLTGGLEQRMNATCAGGTGGFIDTIAFMLGTNAKNISALALGANRIYPIASRCAVFAQTDVRPLLNAGARTSDLAASALEAVVRQTLGGLACGRPIKGTVVFLGGPLEHIPELVRRFRNALGISHKEGIKPPDAHLFTACGAAVLGAEEWKTGKTSGAPGTAAVPGAANMPGASVAPSAAVDAATTLQEGASQTEDVSRETTPPTATDAASPSEKANASEIVSRETISLAALEARVRAMANPENDLVRLPPLFASDEEYTAFKERHSANRMERGRLFDCKGPIYLGIDAGSTAVKIAAINETGQLVYSDYHATKGDALNTTAEMLGDFYAALPRAADRRPYAYVAHATVTGYGEDLLRAGLSVDSGVVETLAHVRAARQFRPDLTFLLDIGGQDMKAIWVRNGRVVNAVLNEACSSGCGSFLEGTAYSLRLTPYRFAAEALTAKEPVDLGTKCTVFMTSRVRHAQKIGVPSGDIAAGLSYSVVKNALFRIIGANQLHTLGPCVVVQGGAFMSDAVLRAFELVSGVEAVRPDTAHLMGAIGAALTARLRAHKNAAEARTGAEAEAGAEAGVEATTEAGARAAVKAVVRKEANLAEDEGEYRPSADVHEKSSAATTAKQNDGYEPRSTLISEKALATLNPKRIAVRCPGCENSCALSVVEFEGGHRFISGNRCERAYEHVDEVRNASRAALPSLGAQPNAQPGDATTAAMFHVKHPDASHNVCAESGLREKDAPNPSAHSNATAPASPRETNSERAAAENKSHRTRKQPPNAVALEQRLLARYGDVNNNGERGQARIGYIDALSGYENKPFWHTLLAQLGFSVMVPDAQRASENGATREGLESIPSESVCFPAKLSHMRLYDVARAGAHAAFMPRFNRAERCPVTSEYAWALEDSSPLTREGACPLVSPLLIWPAPAIMRETEEDVETLLASLNQFAMREDVPAVSKAELLDAIDAGIAEQESFKRTVQQGNEQVLAWSERAGNRAVILGGRPYHMDPAMLHGIDETLVNVGFGVFAQLGLREVFKQEKKVDVIKQAALKKAAIEVAAGNDAAMAPKGDAPWTPGKHFRRLARIAIEHPHIDLVCLQSFGCGYDAVSLMEARDLLESANRPFTSLKIDDIADTAHIRIRLRTLAETLEAE